MAVNSLAVGLGAAAGEQKPGLRRAAEVRHLVVAVEGRAAAAPTEAPNHHGLSSAARGLSGAPRGRTDVRADCGRACRAAWAAPARLARPERAEAGRLILPLVGGMPAGARRSASVGAPCCGSPGVGCASSRSSLAVGSSGTPDVGALAQGRAGLPCVTDSWRTSLPAAAKAASGETTAKMKAHRPSG